jgi:NitT/TauT family transport system substrate-binding protein
MRDFRAFIQSGKSIQGAQEYNSGGNAPGHRADRRNFLVAATGMALFAGLGSFAGCATDEEPGLRIATNPWIGYELLYLSRELGHLDNTGVHLVELLSNSDSIQALSAGTVDGAGLTLDEALAARAVGLDLKIVLVFDYSVGADVLLARPEIGHLAALKGKRIGVEQTGVGALMLDAALKQAGLIAADIKVISLTVDQHLDAYRNGEVDALVTFEPVAGQVAAAGARRLFDSSGIPGSIIDVLALSTKALEANPKTARQLVARYFQAQAYLRQNPTDAARLLAPRLGLTPAAVQAGYQQIALPDLAENRRLLNGSPSPLAATAAQLATLMLQKGLLARETSVTSLIDARCLPEAQS